MRKRYLVALLIAVSFLGIVKYIELRSKNQLLLENLDLMQNKIFVSEDEKERLFQEISQLNFKLSEAEKIIRQLRISAALLREEKVQLDQEASILRYEKEYLKDYLELKSYSLEELKAAIRQVKKEMRLVNLPLGVTEKNS